MKKYINSVVLAVGFGMALALPSCVTGQSNPTPTGGTPATEASATPSTIPPSPTEEPSETTVFTYTCGNGETFSAEFTRQQATMTLGDRELTLNQGVSASGARYSNGETTLHTKGNAAFVEVAGEIILQDCVPETSELSNPAATPSAFEINEFTVDEILTPGCGMALSRSNQPDENRSFIFYNGLGPDTMQMKINGTMLQFNRTEANGEPFYGQYPEQSFVSQSGSTTVTLNVEKGPDGLEEVVDVQGTLRVVHEGQEMIIEVKGVAGC